MYLCHVVLGYRCIRTELINLDLTCPLTHQLLWSSRGDSRPDLSFDKSASLECLFGLARVSLAGASKLDLSFGWSGGDYTSSCPPSLVSAKLAYATIDDPRPAVSSFSMADVRRLSAHLIKLRDMPKGILVLFGLSRVWKSHVCDPVLRGADGNGIGLWAFMIFPAFPSRPVLRSRRSPISMLDPTPKDLAVGTPSSKTLSKAEALQKRKASTFGSTLSYVAERDFDDESDGDDDACVKIPLVTPLRSAAVIPSLGNQGHRSTVPTAEGSNTRGKGIMVDDAVALSVGASRPRPSSGPALSFRDVSSDAIHADFFPFLLVHIMPLILKMALLGIDPIICKTVVDKFPTPGEMVRVEALFEDSLTTKMSVLHFMMISHGGDLFARYHVSTLKNQVSGLNDKLVSSDASFSKSKSKGKERKKKIKSLTRILDNLHAEVARLSAALNQATVLEAEKDEEILRLKETPTEFASFFRGQFQDLVRKFLASDEFSKVQGELVSLAASAGFKRGLSMHQTKDEFVVMLKKMASFMPGSFLNKIFEHASEPLSVILQLEPEKLVRPANIPILRDAHVSPPITKELTVTPASKSLELSTNADLTQSVVASEHNKEMGISVALEDAVKLVVVGSGCAPSGPNDVVISLSAGEKGDDLVPFFAADEDAVVNPSGV
ncbi:hypothetical protein Tco_0943355 [Tanacetum coccineum]